MKRSSLLFPLLLAFIATFFFLSFQGCTGPDHSERIEKIDSLRTRLNELKERTGRIDTGRVLSLEKKVEEQIRIFKAHFENDSMGKGLFKALKNHKQTKESMEGYEKVLHRLEEGLEKSEEKLKALKKDLRRGKHSPKKADQYIEDEKKVLHQLQGSVKELQKRTQAVLENYKSYSGKLRKHLNLPDSVSWPGMKKQ